jgi:hypothetical protein
MSVVSRGIERAEGVDGDWGARSEIFAEGTAHTTTNKKCDVHRAAGLARYRQGVVGSWWGLECMCGPVAASRATKT